jgi:hypothetical protein
MSQDNPFV